MRRSKPLVVVIGVALVLGVGFAVATVLRSNPVKSNPVTTDACGSVTEAPTYKHVVVIVEENHSYGPIIGSGDAPYIDSLAASCGTATNYHNVTHFSLPNYLALTGGLSLSALAPFYNDCSPTSCAWPGSSIFGQTFAKSYQESMPYNCDTTASGLYAPKHNPELYFSDANCSTRDVPFSGGSGGGTSTCPSTVKQGASGAVVRTLQMDLNRWGAKPHLTINGNFDVPTQMAVDYLKSANGLPADGVASLKVWAVLGACRSGGTTGLIADFQTQAAAPAFAFVAPNLCNDMHDCSVATGDEWLKTNLAALLATPVYKSGNTAVFLTWDEGEPGSAGAACANNVSDQGCHVALLVIAPSVKPGTQVNTPLDHYSLLRTVEQLLGLAYLREAQTATSMVQAFNL